MCLLNDGDNDDNSTTMMQERLQTVADLLEEETGKVCYGCCLFVRLLVSECLCFVCLCRALLNSVTIELYSTSGDSCRLA